MVDAFANSSDAFASGLYIEGKKFVVLNADDKVVRARQVKFFPVTSCQHTHTHQVTWSILLSFSFDKHHESCDWMNMGVLLNPLEMREGTTADKDWHRKNESRAGGMRDYFVLVPYYLLMVHTSLGAT